MQNKFNLPVLKLRKDIRKGYFGRLIHGSVIVRWKRDRSYYNQARWRGTLEIRWRVVSNQASHHLDLMRSIMESQFLLMQKVLIICRHRNRGYCFNNFQI